MAASTTTSRPGDPIPFSVRPAKPILRYGPHEASAADARARIIAFFGQPVKAEHH